MQTYTAAHIVNALLKHGRQSTAWFSAMKLQRLAYFTSVGYARATGEPLLSESFSAWKYGPALPGVHAYFDSLDGEPILAYMKDTVGRAFVPDLTVDEDLAQVIDEVWKRAGARSAADLSRAATIPGSAWESVWKASGEGAEIPFDVLRTDIAYDTLLDPNRG